MPRVDEQQETDGLLNRPSKVRIYQAIEFLRRRVAAPRITVSGEIDQV